MPTKRHRLDSLTTWTWGELDTLLGDATVNNSIAAMNAEIDALTAVANRSAAQNVDLRALRRDKADAQRWVRLARLALLLDGSRARDADVNGTDG